jgi:hypothetical protein
MHPKPVCAEEKIVCGEKKTVSIDPEPLAHTCKLRQKHKKPLEDCMRGRENCKLDPKPFALTCKLQQETQETLSVIFQ